MTDHVLKKQVYYFPIVWKENNVEAVRGGEREIEREGM